MSVNGGRACSCAGVERDLRDGFLRVQAVEVAEDGLLRGARRIRFPRNVGLGVGPRHVRMDLVQAGAHVARSPVLERLDGVDDTVTTGQPSPEAVLDNLQLAVDDCLFLIDSRGLQMEALLTQAPSHGDEPHTSYGRSVVSLRQY